MMPTSATDTTIESLVSKRFRRHCTQRPWLIKYLSRTLKLRYTLIRTSNFEGSVIVEVDLELMRTLLQ